jgi:hypothetical protein
MDISAGSESELVFFWPVKACAMMIWRILLQPLICFGSLARDSS